MQIKLSFDRFRSWAFYHLTYCLLPPCFTFKFRGSFRLFILHCYVAFLSCCVRGPTRTSMPVIALCLLWTVDRCYQRQEYDWGSDCRQEASSCITTECCVFTFQHQSLLWVRDLRHWVTYARFDQCRVAKWRLQWNLGFTVCSYRESLVCVFQQAVGRA